MLQQFEAHSQSTTERWQTQGHGKQTIKCVWENGWRLEHNLEAQAQSTALEHQARSQRDRNQE